MTSARYRVLSIVLLAATAATTVLGGDLIAQLSSDDPAQRKEAARALGSSRNLRAVPHLIKLLRDYPQDHRLRNYPPYGTPSWEACDALVRIGEKAVPGLLEALKNEDTRIVALACCILGQIGDKRAAQPLLPLLNARDHEVRAHAALSLGRLSKHLESLDPLEHACNDPHGLVSSLAISGLGFSGDVRTHALLLAILRNQEHRYRSEACRSVARLKCQEAVPLLLPLLEGPDNHTRWTAIYALGELEHQGAAKPIMQILATRGLHPTTYVACVRSLLKLRAPGALDAVAALFDRGDQILAVLAVDELAKLGNDAEPYLAEALCSEDAKVREAATRGFKQLHGPRFDEGGKEWYTWLAKHYREHGSPPDLASVQSARALPPHRKRLVQVHEFKIEEQTSASQFTVANGRLYASLQQSVAAGVNPRGNPRHQAAHVLVAWDLEGRLLWKANYPRPYRMCMAGGVLVLAIDDGTLSAERVMIWIDPANGRELHQIALPGRPATLTFNLTSETVMVVMYPQHRMRTLDGAWMEMRSYRSGELAWMCKEQVTELSGLSLDGPVVVIGSRCSGADFVAGLDAITGKELWRRRWSTYPHVPEAGTKAPEDMSGLTVIPSWQGVEFVEPRSGKTVAAAPTPFGAAGTTAHKDRLYFTAHKLEGFTMGACAFPTGKPVWADKTNTVCYGQPVAWGENVVFLARRLSNGLTGHVTLTELRVYGPRGDLRCHAAREKEHWDDTATPVADGKYLYLIDARKIVALQLQPAD